MDIIYDPIRLVSSLTMKRKALVVRNGSTPESEDVVKEQDELSSTSSVSLNSQDETHEKEADSLKTKKETKKRSRHHVRVFMPRDSLVTTLRYNNPHFETLINSGVCMMVTMCMYDIIKNSFEKGRLHLDTEDYFFAFGEVSDQFLTALVWVSLLAATLLVHPLFILWKTVRPVSPTLMDFTFATVYIFYQVTAHSYVISIIVAQGLAAAPSLFLSVEQIRMSMKSYSFVRENAFKVLKPWKAKESTGPAMWYLGQMKPQVGSLKQYLYFIFVPTLLYRDEYPRTSKINYRRAGQYLFEVVGLLVVTIMCLKNFIRPSFMALPSDPPRYLLMSLLGLVSMGLFLLFTTNGCILHAWMNFNAEITRFADRHFYEDWWTCIDFQTFYRKWNYVVYDWIHAYFYHDLKLAINSKLYRRLAPIPVMIVSSIFHEYILSVALKYCIPFLTIEFALLGGVFYFLRPVLLGQRTWNTLFLLALSIGQGLMVWLYSVEYYARLFCPKEDSLYNAFIPRMYECFLSNQTLVF